MSSPLETLMRSSVMKNALFPPTSRYHGFETLSLTLADGSTVLFLERRFIPQPEELHLLQVHTVSGGERLDNITAYYMNDPELFWRICDANRAMLPVELTNTVGRQLRITMPKGIPGAADA